jgi:hypothetical protein
MNFIGVMIDRVAALAETTEPYASIVYGSDPPLNGICMIQNGGYAPETHLDKGMMYSVPVLLNGKHPNQQTVLDALTAIHEILTKHDNYNDVSTNAVQVVAITTTAAPSVIGREQNNQWICGSSFDVYFYWR